MSKISSLLSAACLFCAGAALAQQPAASPAVPADTSAAAPAAAATTTGTAAEAPAPIEPPPAAPTIPGEAPGYNTSAMPAGSTTDQAAQTGTTGATSPAAAANAVTLGSAPAGNPNGKALNEFSGDDVAQVLRLLARQAKISLVVSDRIAEAQPPMKVTMRLENSSPMEAINVIVEAKGLVFDKIGNVYYVKTKEEKDAEPTETASYTFSYASAEKVSPLLASELVSKAAPQFDPRTNTIFYREVHSNLDKIKTFLEMIDQPTQQVMIEARLVEVTANPVQAYGLNWAGIVGDATSPKEFQYGGSNIGSDTTTSVTNGSVTPIATGASTTAANGSSYTPQPNLFGNAGNFLLSGGGGTALRMLSGQFAILSAPQMAITMELMNEDSDAEFLANPRVVTANNQQATIKITRNQPVPQLNFNQQSATPVFGGFQDKEYGNTLVVLPSINKDNFITLNVKPQISNKVGDQVFTFQGATVSSPIIDERDLESNVVIKSGDTLAIGGLLQDEVTKGRTKVPVLGDVPGLGYLFQQHTNTRVKRNLLVFVTPTIIKQGYGTGLEDQVSGLHHSGEEYSDPDGWRNNARGAIRLVPTSEREVAADYPKPGVAPEPVHAGGVDYRTSAAGGGQ